MDDNVLTEEFRKKLEEAFTKRIGKRVSKKDIMKDLQSVLSTFTIKTPHVDVAFNEDKSVTYTITRGAL